MLDTSIIIPTHNRFRNPVKAKELIMVREYCDYILNNQRGPIVLIQTEDGQLWCHDGHHRLAAVDYHYGKIDSNYVEILNYDYAQLNSINLDCNYVTPYDPRIECRHEDFWTDKKNILIEIQMIYLYDVKPKEQAVKDIVARYVYSYKEPRQIHTLRELCNTVL